MIEQLLSSEIYHRDHDHRWSSSAEKRHRHSFLSIFWTNGSVNFSVTSGVRLFSTYLWKNMWNKMRHAEHWDSPITDRRCQIWYSQSSSLDSLYCSRSFWPWQQVRLLAAKCGPLCRHQLCSKKPLLVAGNLLLVAPTCEEWVQGIAYKRTLGPRSSVPSFFWHIFFVSKMLAPKCIEMLDPIFSGSNFCWGFPLFSDPNRL